MVSWIWPTDFPTDCPPGDARPTNGTYYHIVKSDPPGPRDFVSQYHKNRRLAENNVNRGYATLARRWDFQFLRILKRQWTAFTNTPNWAIKSRNRPFAKWPVR